MQAEGSEVGIGPMGSKGAPMTWKSEAKEVAELVSVATEVPVDLMMSRIRRRPVVRARRIAFAALRKMGYSLLGIKWMTGYCHTTIMPALKNVTPEEDQIASNVVVKLREADVDPTTKEIIRMYKEGLSVPQVAVAVKRGETSVYKTLKAAGVETRSKSQATILSRASQPHKMDCHPWRRQ